MIKYRSENNFMKKASKILLIIAGVFNILYLLGVVIAGLVLIIEALVTKATVDPSFYSELEQMISEMGLSVNADTLMWIVIAIYCVIILLIQLVAFVLFLVAAIVSFKGSKAKKKGVLIANIVFYVLTSCVNLLMLVGAILGLIGLGIEAKKEESEPVKEEPKKVEKKAEAKEKPEAKEVSEPEPIDDEPLDDEKPSLKVSDE